MESIFLWPSLTISIFRLLLNGPFVFEENRSMVVPTHGYTLDLNFMVSVVDIVGPPWCLLQPLPGFAWFWCGFAVGTVFPCPVDVELSHSGLALADETQ